MKIYKPNFWKTKLNIFSVMLFPFSLLTSLVVFLKKKIIKPINFKTKIICIGNLYLGGTGKTPLSILLAEELEKIGKNPAIVKKYYKNQEDERDLIIHHFSKLISMKSRVKAIYEAMEKKFETIILDDGFQDYKIKKNVSILCFNEIQLIGNGLIFPSGPLRENLNSVKDADIILINGKRNIKFEKKILGIKSGLEVFYSNYKLINFEKYENKKLFAFAGIGNPENFFSLLENYNLKVIEKMSFPDHYQFTSSDLKFIISKAKKQDAVLITTEKDYFRIKNLKIDEIKYVELKLQIQNKEKFLKSVIEKI